MVERMRARDLAFLTAETSSTPRHNATIEVFDPGDSGFDHGTLTRLIVDRIAFVPRYRQRVRWVPGHIAKASGEDCTREVSMVKAYCGELVNEVLYACVQCHGGMGFMRGTAIERMSRDVRVQTIGGGATEVMLEEVAKRL